MLFRLCRRDIDSGARGRRLALRHSAARILDPGVETLARDHLYADRHEGMIAPAQLVAFAIVSSFALDTGPSLVEPPRDGVLFYSQRLDAPRMHHVRGGGPNGEDPLNREHHLFINLHNAQRAPLRS